MLKTVGVRSIRLIPRRLYGFAGSRFVHHRSGASVSLSGRSLMIFFNKGNSIRQKEIKVWLLTKDQEE
ncbi:hypothetical protein ACWFPQ_17670 [Peribacillus butanolivorans]